MVLDTNVLLVTDAYMKRFLFQATEEPVTAINGMESMLRPFSLVIPFTVQKGEITGLIRA